jgi:hypothetical protein
MTTPDYDTDVYGWTQAQAALIRARAWEALDVAHVAEEIEDLCKTDAHHLTMLVLGFIELIDRPCGDEQGQYDWQSAVIDHHRAMLAYRLEESPRVRPVMERQLPNPTAGPAGRSCAGAPRRRASRRRSVPGPWPGGSTSAGGRGRLRHGCREPTRGAWAVVATPGAPGEGNA